jgi:hypothetical protein
VPPRRCRAPDPPGPPAHPSLAPPPHLFKFRDIKRGKPGRSDFQYIAKSHHFLKNRFVGDLERTGTGEGRVPGGGKGIKSCESFWWEGDAVGGKGREWGTHLCLLPCPCRGLLGSPWHPPARTTTFIGHDISTRETYVQSEMEVGGDSQRLTERHSGRGLAYP